MNEDINDNTYDEIFFDEDYFESWDINDLMSDLEMTYASKMDNMDTTTY